MESISASAMESSRDLTNNCHQQRPPINPSYQQVPTSTHQKSNHRRILAQHHFLYKLLCFFLCYGQRQGVGPNIDIIVKKEEKEYNDKSVMIGIHQKDAYVSDEYKVNVIY